MSEARLPQRCALPVSGLGLRRRRTVQVCCEPASDYRLRGLQAPVESSVRQFEGAAPGPGFCQWGAQLDMLRELESRGRLSPMVTGQMVAGQSPPLRVAQLIGPGATTQPHLSRNSPPNLKQQH